MTKYSRSIFVICCEAMLCWCCVLFMPDKRVFTKKTWKTCTNASKENLATPHKYAKYLKEAIICGEVIPCINIVSPVIYYINTK